MSPVPERKVLWVHDSSTDVRNPYRPLLGQDRFYCTDSLLFEVGDLEEEVGQAGTDFAMVVGENFGVGQLRCYLRHLGAGSTPEIRLLVSTGAIGAL